MSERKYKVGDVIRTLVDIDAEGNKLFPKGTIGIITEINDKDSLYPYMVETNEDWWYYSADMIEPVDYDGTPKQEPCKDVVSLGVFEQVMWERDVAIEQLKELGYGFGEKKRTGHWIETAEEYYKAVNEYGGGVNEDTPYFVDDIACSECLSMFSVIDNETERFDCCPHCGTKMVEPQESEEISREEIAALLARESEEQA